MWGAIGGVAVAAGPLVGGAVTSGWSWQSIFWINVPVGIVLAVLARWRLARVARARASPSTSAAWCSPASACSGSSSPWCGPTSTGGPVPVSWRRSRPGSFGLAGFVVWEQRSTHPMMPLRLFRSRSFSAVNAVALFMSFGMFGSIFFLSQFLQVVQHYSPLGAGLRVLPWTGMPMLVAPLAAVLAQRFGGRPVLAAGLVLQAVGLAWLALELTPAVSYSRVWLPFVVSGVGMALFFVPLASVVLSSVRPEQEGVASGANSAFREMGGVLGIAVLGAVFSARGGYASSAAYVAGAASPRCGSAWPSSASGAVVALLMPRRVAARAARVGAGSRPRLCRRRPAMSSSTRLCARSPRP